MQELECPLLTPKLASDPVEEHSPLCVAWGSHLGSCISAEPRSAGGATPRTCSPVWIAFAACHSMTSATHGFITSIVLKKKILRIPTVNPQVCRLSRPTDSGGLQLHCRAVAQTEVLPSALAPSFPAFLPFLSFSLLLSSPSFLPLFLFLSSSRDHLTILPRHIHTSNPAISASQSPCLAWPELPFTCKIDSSSYLLQIK